MERQPIVPKKGTQDPTELGKLVTFTVNITKPFAFKFENADMNSITIYVGANGTGKSYVLKLIWCFGMCTKLYLANRLEVGHKPGMQYIFDKCFHNNDLNGNIIMNYEQGTLELEFKDGQITKISTLIGDNITSATTPVFMGKDMRTFEQIRMYLKFKKSIKLPKILSITQSEQMEILTDMYKIYDIMYVEKLISCLDTEVKAPKSFSDTLKKFDVEIDIALIGYDESNGVIYTKDSKGNRQDLHLLGAGHQSLINMFLANTLFR